MRRTPPRCLRPVARRPSLGRSGGMSSACSAVCPSAPAACPLYPHCSTRLDDATENPQGSHRGPRSGTRRASERTVATMRTPTPPSARRRSRPDGVAHAGRLHQLFGTYYPVTQRRASGRTPRLALTYRSRSTEPSSVTLPGLAQPRSTERATHRRGLRVSAPTLHARRGPRQGDVSCAPRAPAATW